MATWRPVLVDPKSNKTVTVNFDTVKYFETDSAGNAVIYFLDNSAIKSAENAAALLDKIKS